MKYKLNYQVLINNKIYPYLSKNVDLLGIFWHQRSLIKKFHNLQKQI